MEQIGLNICSPKCMKPSIKTECCNYWIVQCLTKKQNNKKINKNVFFLSSFKCSYSWLWMLKDERVYHWKRNKIRVDFFLHTENCNIWFSWWKIFYPENLLLSQEKYWYLYVLDCKGFAAFDRKSHFDGLRMNVSISQQSETFKSILDEFGLHFYIFSWEVGAMESKSQLFM